MDSIPFSIERLNCTHKLLTQLSLLQAYHKAVASSHRHGAAGAGGRHRKTVQKRGNTERKPTNSVYDTALNVRWHLRLPVANTGRVYSRDYTPSDRELAVSIQIVLCLAKLHCSELLTSDARAGRFWQLSSWQLLSNAKWWRVVLNFDVSECCQ